MRTHRRASKVRTQAPEIIDVDPPPDGVDDPPMTTLPDTGLQPVVEEVVLVADPEELEITRPYPRPMVVDPGLYGPPRH
jgi:hypothetical protein